MPRTLYSPYSHFFYSHFSLPHIWLLNCFILFSVLTPKCSVFCLNVPFLLLIFFPLTVYISVTTGGKQYLVSTCAYEYSEKWQSKSWVGKRGGGVMVWAGVCYGQQIQVQDVDRDIVTRSWGPLSGHPSHHLMLQHDNARPHVARICPQFLEAENIPVLGMHGQHTHRTCHPLTMFKDALHRTAFSSSWQYPATLHSH